MTDHPDDQIVPASDDDGAAALWHLPADLLRERQLSSDDIVNDAPTLLDLVLRGTGASVVEITTVRPAKGPFTIYYRAAVQESRQEQEFMLVGQVSHDEGIYQDISGYVVNLTANLARAANEAVRANNDKRAVIEQAKGAFMMAYGIEESEAFTLLVALSSRTNTKLRDVATTVVSLMNEVEYRELHCSQTLLNISQRVLLGQG